MNLCLDAVVKIPPDACSLFPKIKKQIGVSDDDADRLLWLRRDEKCSVVLGIRIRWNFDFEPFFSNFSIQYK